MSPDDESEPGDATGTEPGAVAEAAAPHDESHSPALSRRNLLRGGAASAGAMGLAWSVPTIRPIAKLAAPGSKPPETSQHSVDPPPVTPPAPPSDPQSSSVSGSDVGTDPSTPGYRPEQVEGLETSGPAKPVPGDPDFTG